MFHTFHQRFSTILCVLLARVINITKSYDNDFSKNISCRMWTRIVLIS